MIRLSRLNKLFIKNNRGFIFLETSLSIPIIAMILLSTSLLIYHGWKLYLNEVADWILQEEIFHAMQHITTTISQAEGYYKFDGTFVDGLSVNDDTITVTTASINSERKHITKSVKYFIKANDEGLIQLYANSTEPLTGQNILFGRVAVTRFKCTLKNPDLIRVELAGISQVSLHEYQLATEIYIPNRKHE